MTGWREDLLGLLGFMWMVAPLFYVPYLLATAVRYARRRKRPPNRYAQATVSFHAWWGVALSVPGLTIALLGGPGETWTWFAAPIAFATVACWVIALNAKAGWRLPPALRWVPLGVMLVGLHAFSAVPVAMNHQEDPGWAANFLVNWLMFTNFGLGFAAWITVTICFGRAVRSVDRLAPATPDFERYPTRKRRNFQLPARI